MIDVGATNERLAGEFFAGIVTWRSNEYRGRAIHAQVVACGIIDQIFGVKGATKVVMQIAALGHLAQESQLNGWLSPDRFEIAYGALFSDRGRLRRCRTVGPDDNQKQSSDSRHSFSSEMLPETGIVP